MCLLFPRVMTPSPDDAVRMGRVHALFTRIHLLEQHALTLQAAVRNTAMKAEVQAVIATLHRAEAWLDAVALPDNVSQAEDLVGSASRQISGFGRAK
jgi:hypothetical protein